MTTPKLLVVQVYPPTMSVRTAGFAISSSGSELALRTPLIAAPAVIPGSHAVQMGAAPLSVPENVIVMGTARAGAAQSSTLRAIPAIFTADLQGRQSQQYRLEKSRAKYECLEGIA